MNCPNMKSSAKSRSEIRNYSKVDKIYAVGPMTKAKVLMFITMIV